MRFYDLRKRLCEEKEGTNVGSLHCPSPDDNQVKCTAFTRKSENAGLQLTIPKLTSYKSGHRDDGSGSDSPLSASSDFDSDSDSG